MKHLLLIITTLTVSGCVVNVYPTAHEPLAAQPVSDTIQSTNITLRVPNSPPQTVVEKTTAPVATVPLPEPTQVIVTSAEQCDRFYWPPSPKNPPRAIFVTKMMTQRDDYPPEKINDVLLDYVFALRSYLDDNYLILKVAYLDYLERCNYTLKQPLPARLYPARPLKK